MNDGSSMTSQVPLAFYDPDLSSWKTSQESLLLEEPSLLDRLPGSGTTVAGRLYERETPALLIDVRAGSVLLPTPTAWEQRETPEQWQERHDRNASKEEGATSAGMPLSIAAQLLPTPAAWDGNRGPDNSRLQGDGHRPSGQAGTLNLAGALQMLLTGEDSLQPSFDGKEF